MNTDTLLEGSVQSFNEILGQGFIRPDDGSGRVRVSHKAIALEGYKCLYEGQRVTYEMKIGPHGPVATRVFPA